MIKKMIRDRITIGISGISEGQYEVGREAFIEEFMARSWLLNPIVSWDTQTRRIIVTIDRDEDDDDSNGMGTWDEVWDNVFNAFHFSEYVRVEIIRAEKVNTLFT